MSDTPTCPICGAPMVRRKRRWDNKPFYACPNFSTTGCKGTISTQRKYSGHRKAFELAMDEAIPNGWVIHHCDGNSENNDPSNLVKLPERSHKALHRLAKKMHKEKGWSLEATTVWYFQRMKKKTELIVVEESKIKKLCEP